jgi:hypothetical protein
MHRIPSLILAACSLLIAISPAGAADWESHADVDTVVVVTTDEDGETRETTIWLLVLDGEAYIRTGDTSWARNLERGSSLTLQVASESIATGFARVEDEALFERIEQGFREKYGWSDRMVGWMPGTGTRAYRLVAPEGSRAPE